VKYVFKRLLFRNLVSEQFYSKGDSLGTGEFNAYGNNDKGK
jgi:hypothetical protein